MTKFDASSILEPMEYDFTKFGGRKAETPEPSEDAVVTMYREMDELLKSVASEHVDLPKNPTAMDLVDSLNQLTMNESYQPMLDGMTKIYAKLCSNTPSEEELRQLPPRMRALFFQWVAQQMRPELDAVDSKTPPRTLRTGRGA